MRRKNENSIKTEILEYISKGNISKAITLFHDHTTSENFPNISHEILLQKSILSRAELDFERKQIGREDYNIEINNVTRAILNLIDQTFVSVKEYIPEENAVYFTAFYSRDRKSISSFQVVFDNETRRVIINNTLSNSEYKGKYSLYSNHVCFTVENNTNYLMNMILYSGSSFPHNIQKIVIGIINFITIEGVASSSIVILKRGEYDKVKTLKNLVIKQFILHRPVLGIYNSIKGIFNENDLKRKYKNWNSVKNFSGNYVALIVSNRRKSIIPFLINVDEKGILQSKREPKSEELLDGIIHCVNKNTITINVYLEDRDEKLYAEFRVYLDSSKQSYSKNKFYKGTYSSLSIRGQEPRAGRCVMINSETNNFEPFGTKPILIGSEQYKKLIKEYDSLENFLIGNEDNFVEDYKSILNTKMNS